LQHGAKLGVTHTVQVLPGAYTNRYALQLCLPYWAKPGRDA